jgi:hypothetical protein
MKLKYRSWAIDRPGNQTLQISDREGRTKKLANGKAVLSEDEAAFGLGNWQSFNRQIAQSPITNRQSQIVHHAKPW